MCTKFLRYVEKKLSCFGQGEIEDDCSEERSTRDEESRNSSETNQESDQEYSSSFHSYSDEDSPGEDVVESTGRNGTRSSSYEDCYSKTMGSTSTVGNAVGLRRSDESSKINSLEQRKKKCVASSKRVRKQEKEEEIKGNPMRRVANQEVRTPKKEHDVHKASSESDSKVSSMKKEKPNQTQNLTKVPAVPKKEDEKTSEKVLKVKGEQEKSTRRSVREKMPSKKESEKTRNFKAKKKLEGEKKRVMKPVEKKKNAAVGQGGKTLATDKKENLSKNKRTDSKVGPLKIARKKPAEQENQKKPSTSNNSNVTFSKRTKVIPSRSIRSFRSQTLAKRTSSVKPTMRNPSLPRGGGILKRR